MEIKEINLLAHSDYSIFDNNIYINDNLIGKEKLKIYRLGNLIKYNNKTYTVVQIREYEHNYSIYFEEYEEVEKRSILVNLNFEYVNLLEVEETLYNLFGYKLYKVDKEAEK